MPPGVEVPGPGRRVEFGRGRFRRTRSGSAAPTTWRTPWEPLRRRSSGVPAEAVAEALRTFAGVPHRLEEVATVGGVLYVNDSKATNVASAARGIGAFEGGVHAILGGSLKGGGFTGLRERSRARARGYLIGEAADRLEADLEGTVPLRRCGDLETAVGEARAAAGPGRGRPPLAGVRQLRPVPRLRGARRAFRRWFREDESGR